MLLEPENVWLRTGEALPSPGATGGWLLSDNSNKRRERTSVSRRGEPGRRSGRCYRNVTCIHVVLEGTLVVWADRALGPLAVSLCLFSIIYVHFLLCVLGVCRCGSRSRQWRRNPGAAQSLPMKGWEDTGGLRFWVGAFGGDIGYHPLGKWQVCCMNLERCGAAAKLPSPMSHGVFNPGRVNHAQHRPGSSSHVKT